MEIRNGSVYRSLLRLARVLVFGVIAGGLSWLADEQGADGNLPEIIFLAGTPLLVALDKFVRTQWGA